MGSRGARAALASYAARVEWSHLAIAALLTVHVLVVAFGVLTFFCADRYLDVFLGSAGVVVLATVVGIARARAAPAAATGLAATATGAFLLGWLVFSGLGPERDELSREGDAFVACIERFRARAGKCPATLEEAGGAPRWNRFGGWSYALDGDAWRLSVGEYAADGFVLTWDARTGWSWDS